jgi:hypothetical protein
MQEIEMPDGSIVEFPDNMTDDQIASILRAQPKQTETPGVIAPTLHDATTGVGQGITLGFGDEIMAGMAAPFRAGYNWMKGDGFDLGSAYDTELENQRRILHTAKERSPVASTVGEVTGAMATVPKAIGGAAVKATYPAMMARGAGTGAAAGAAYGFGTGEGGLENRATDAAIGGAVGGVTGGVMGAVGARKASKAAKVATREAAEELFDETSGFYRQLKDLPAYTDQKAVKGVVPKMEAALRAENMSEEIHTKAFKTVQNMAKGFDNAPQTPGTLEAWRRRIKTDLLSSSSADEREAGRIIMEQLDDFVNSGAGGDVAKAARATFRKAVQADKIEFAIKQAERVAERGGKNFTHHLATQLQRLVTADERAIAKGRPPQFDKATRDLMDKIARNRGGKILDWLGNFSPEGRLQAMLNLFVGGGLGVATGGASIPFQLGLGAAGMTAKAISNARSTGAVNKLQQSVIGRGGPPQLSAEARALLERMTRGTIAATQ